MIQFPPGTKVKLKQQRWDTLTSYYQKYWDLNVIYNVDYSGYVWRTDGNGYICGTHTNFELVEQFEEVYI